MIVEVVSGTIMLVIGTAGASLAAGAEMGAYTVNRIRLSVRARSATARGAPRMLSAARTLHEELKHPTRLLAALLLTYNAMSYIAAEGLTSLMHHGGMNETQILIATIFIVTPLLFVVNDAGPKEAFRVGADRLMYTFAPVIRLVRVLLQYSLVLPSVQLIARSLARLVPGGASFDVQTPRQNIAELLKEGVRHGVMSESQVTLLDAAMTLRDTCVGDEMVPWMRCRVIQDNWTRSRVLDFISAYPQSRFPMVNARGGVIGIVEALDVCLNPDASITDLARPALDLDPDMPVRAALVKLNESGAKMAVVRLRGKPVGIVTAKDLVEPLTGEIAAW